LGAEHPQGSLPITGETLFRVASLSKIALALAMLRLHDAGLMDLDADISSVLKRPISHPLHLQVPLTPRLLLTHRSGLLDRATLPLPSGDALRKVLSEPTQWGTEQPGTVFRYSNLGSVVLATAMEAAAQQPFDALMQRWLFDPLGLEARYAISALSARQREQLATLYRRPEGSARWLPQFDGRADGPHPYATPAALAAVGENASVHSPQGGLRIGMPDLARLAQFIIRKGLWNGQRLIASESFQQLTKPHWTVTAQTPGETAGGLFRSWALGLQYFSDASDAQGGDRLIRAGGLRGVGHLGSAYGLLSGLVVLPEQSARPAGGFVYVINGASQGALDSAGKFSSFRLCEERLIATLMDTLSRSSPAR
jgi:CubicO group peptidase (beta-lactamase class C family)